jgi:hypothetical protein
MTLSEANMPYSNTGTDEAEFIKVENEEKMAQFKALPSYSLERLRKTIIASERTTDFLTENQS